MYNILHYKYTVWQYDSVHMIIIYNIGLLVLNKFKSDILYIKYQRSSLQLTIFCNNNIIIALRNKLVTTINKSEGIVIILYRPYEVPLILTI